MLVKQIHQHYSATIWKIWNSGESTPLELLERKHNLVSYVNSWWQNTSDSQQGPTWTTQLRSETKLFQRMLYNFMKPTIQKQKKYSRWRFKHHRSASYLHRPNDFCFCFCRDVALVLRWRGALCKSTNSGKRSHWSNSKHALTLVSVLICEKFEKTDEVMPL